MFDENRIVSRFLKIDEELYRGKEYFRKIRRANRLATYSDYDSDSDTDSDSDYDPEADPLADYFNSISEDRYDDSECIEI